jgi:hypothetical protein
MSRSQSTLVILSMDGVVQQHHYVLIVAQCDFTTVSLSSIINLTSTQYGSDFCI